MHNPLMKMMAKLNSFWIVHFFDDEHKFIDTEELIFPTDLTEENIEAAIKEAEKECEDNGYKFISLDLLDIENGALMHIWTFPRDLGCFT